jgi:hypothetical protein
VHAGSAIEAAIGTVPDRAGSASSALISGLVASTIADPGHARSRRSCGDVLDRSVGGRTAPTVSLVVDDLEARAPLAWYVLVRAK